MVMTAVVAVSTCCGSVATATPRGASLVAAVVLPVTRGALDERRLMGTAASDLNTLAGARGARSASPCEREDRKIKLPPLEDGASREVIAYLRVEKPRSLFLEGSTGAVAAADVATVAPPDASTVRANTSAARAGTPVAHVGTSAARAAALMDCLAAGAPAPASGACSPATSAALGEGARAPTSRGEPAPRRSPPPLPRSTTSTPRSPGGESLLLAQPKLLISLLPALLPPDPSLLLTRRLLLLLALSRARARARGVGGSDRATFTVTLCWEE
jgi:hypothetical protein